MSQRKLTQAQKRQVRKAASAYRMYFAMGGMAAYTLYCVALGVTPFGSLQTSSFDEGSAHSKGRRLSGGGCPADPSYGGQGGGHVTGYIIMCLYMFLGLAIVCDEWFVPSLEKISETLSLSADVAGATFLAAGSSAPEFFTSLADTFSTSNSVGVGTIVGSAMFNILVIVAMAAASTKETLHIDWRPVVRDCGFYAASIATLIIFFNDGRIYWWEGLIMTLIYVLYIVFMIFNERIFKKCEKKKVQPEPAYAPGRRQSVHHHKGMFQGKIRDVHLEDGTTGKLNEDGNVVGDNGQVIKEIVPQADAEKAVEMAEQPSEKPTEKDAQGNDDDDEDDPDDYFSRFKW